MRMDLDDFQMMNLCSILTRAKTAAIAADPGEGNDGGTSNLDTPAFRVEGASDKRIQAAARLAGVSVTDFKWLGGKKWYWITGITQGQGDRRSAMMQAAQRVLDEAAKTRELNGLHACGYMQAD